MEATAEPWLGVVVGGGVLCLAGGLWLAGDHQQSAAIMMLLAATASVSRDVKKDGFSAGTVSISLLDGGPPAGVSDRRIIIDPGAMRTRFVSASATEEEAGRLFLASRDNLADTTTRYFIAPPARTSFAQDLARLQEGTVMLE